ncbi:Ectropic viral integration site 2A protein (EVI2A) [Pilibacter termitis]|uniref:Ectropic viral integration site 2A protein (EVI2A) n=1 Tax=Pilibacter termitis TaxID=263852 RepID=A0A1T4LSJ2_9ENTE|nr:hypothetical protein [Pilibacter termitis]SJZ57488.1 Ectropic viral integration site 2A protein (EVI2A) [Pilibacter termitis]
MKPILKQVKIIFFFCFLFFILDSSICHAADNVAGDVHDLVNVKVTNQKDPKRWEFSVEIIRDGNAIPADDGMNQVKIVVARMDNSVTRASTEVMTNKEGKAYVDASKIYQEDKKAPVDSAIVLLPVSINGQALDGKAENTEIPISKEVYANIKGNSGTNQNSTSAETKKSSEKDTKTQSKKEESKSSSSSTTSKTSTTKKASEASKAKSSSSKEESSESTSPKEEQIKADSVRKNVNSKNNNGLFFLIPLLVCVIAIGLGIARWLQLKIKRKNEEIAMMEAFYQEVSHNLIERRKRRRAKRDKRRRKKGFSSLNT